MSGRKAYKPYVQPKLLTDLTEANQIIKRLENQLQESKEAIAASDRLEKQLQAIEKQADGCVEKIRLHMDRTRQRWRERFEHIEDEETLCPPPKKPPAPEIKAETRSPVHNGGLEGLMQMLATKVDLVTDLVKNGNNKAHPNQQPIFGVGEIAYVYEDTNAKLDSMVGAIQKLKKMPDFYSNEPRHGGLRMKEDIDYALYVLEAFRQKMKISASGYDTRGKQTDREPDFQLNVIETSPLSCESQDSITLTPQNKA